MTLSQQKFREIVFQLLYSQDIGHPDEALTIELLMVELAVSKRNMRLAFERVRRIIEKLEEIDGLIASASTSYDFSRIQTVTKNILRVGVFELFFDDQIPPKVAIAEAIRLSRKFCTRESASFANALLDNLYQSSLGTPVDPERLKQQSQLLFQSEQKAADVNEQNIEEKNHQEKTSDDVENF